MNKKIINKKVKITTPVIFPELMRKYREGVGGDGGGGGRNEAHFRMC